MNASESGREVRADRRRWDIVAFGEGLVEFNQDSATGLFRLGHGGDTSNCVIAAARLGARCAYITSIGDDEFGDELLALWKREGVGLDGVRRMPGEATGVYFVHHGAGGHRFTYRRAGSAASKMTAEKVCAAPLRETAWFHLSGISLAIGPGPALAAEAASEIATRHGARVCFDLNYRPALQTTTDALRAARRLLVQGPLFLVSVDEAEQVLSLTSPRDIVKWGHDHGASSVVVKDGARGCVLSDGTGVSECEGLGVQAVDATGAGDCFAGACLYRLAMGDDLPAAARFANVAAALSTRGYGAVAPLPTAAAVEAALSAMGVRTGTP